LEKSYLHIGEVIKNEAIYRHETSNDLVTEPVLFDAFFCAFPSHKGSKSMKYVKLISVLHSFTLFG